MTTDLSKTVLWFKEYLSYFLTMSENIELMYCYIKMHFYFNVLNINTAVIYL